MGQKQSLTSDWSVDDWAFGTGANAVPIEAVFEEAKKAPVKYFGGEQIENDPSMHQMQHDLLSFDDTLKRIFFRWRKGKRSKKHNHRDMAYEQNVDQAQQYNEETDYYPYEDPESIPEESVNDYSKELSSDKEDIVKGDLDTYPPWRCRYCTAENKSTDVDCRQCKESESHF